MKKKSRTSTISYWRAPKGNRYGSIFMTIDGKRPVAVTPDPTAPYGHRTLYARLNALLKEEKSSCRYFYLCA